MTAAATDAAHTTAEEGNDRHRVDGAAPPTSTGAELGRWRELLPLGGPPPPPAPPDWRASRGSPPDRGIEYRELRADQATIKRRKQPQSVQEQQRNRSTSTSTPKCCYAARYADNTSNTSYALDTIQHRGASELHARIACTLHAHLRVFRRIACASPGGSSNCMRISGCFVELHAPRTCT